MALALSIGERFARHGLDDVELADADQHLHQPDPRAIDERPLAHQSGDAQALFHAFPRDLVVAAEETSPAELEPREADLAVAAGSAPDRLCVLDRCAGSGKIARPRGQLARGGQRARPNLIARWRF